jgi:molecular chaperone DnaK
MSIYTAEKGLKDAGDKVPADVKTSVEEKIEAVKKVKDGTDADALKKATEELSNEMMKIGEAMQKAQAENPAPAEEPKAENVQDAEVKEEGENK